MPLDIMSLLGGGQQQDQQDDPLAALGLSPVSHKDAMTMSLLQAVQAQQQAGLQRTASPIGAIANALIPLVAAPIQANQIQARSLREILPILAELRRDDPEKAALEKQKLKKEVAGYGKPKSLEDFAVQKLGPNATLDQILATKRGLEKPERPNEMDVQRGALADILGREPSDRELFGFQQNIKNQQAAQASALIEGRMNSALQAKEQADEVRRRMTVIDGQKGYVISPETGERVLNARQGQVDDQNLVVLKPRQYEMMNRAKKALMQIEQLKALIPKVLPEKQDSLLGRAMSLSGIKKQKMLGTSEEVTKFETLSKFSKLPVIQSLQESGRIPLSEVAALPDLSRDSDTQESAMARLNIVESWVRSALSDMDLSPDVMLKNQKPDQQLENGLKIWR